MSAPVDAPVAAGMSAGFTYEALPMRVVFGVGASERVDQELDALGYDRVLVLCTPEQTAVASSISDALGARSVGVHPGARMHVPVESADAAVDLARERGADACLAVGGGSTTGLGKAVALRHHLPVVAVPTTYAGSEMTPIWGLTEGGTKTTGRDSAVLPRAVVYDPLLTLGLPVDLSVTSGLNAVAHAVEGLWAPNASPITSLMAAEGVRALLAALPRVVAAPDDVDARSEALRGAWLCGAVLGATTMSLHHKLCHVLGGSWDLPHAAVHAAVLPHVLAFNAPAAPAAVAALTPALGLGSAGAGSVSGDAHGGSSAPDVAGALWDLARALGAPTSLADVGLPADAVDEVVSRVLAAPYANPRPVKADALAALLRAAVAGTRPVTAAP